MDPKVSEEVTELSTIYINESKSLLEKEPIENKERIRQRFELRDLKKELILNRPRKVLRQLKKIEANSIYEVNNSLYAFLHYTSYALIENEKKSDMWKSKVSLVDLKKAKLIINNNS